MITDHVQVTPCLAGTFHYYEQSKRSTHKLKYWTYFQQHQCTLSIFRRIRFKVKWNHNLETVFFQFYFSENHLGREVNLSACFNVVLVLLIRLPQVCRALKSYKVEQRLKVKALLGGPEHQNILHLFSNHTSSQSMLIYGPIKENCAPPPKKTNSWAQFAHSLWDLTKYTATYQS